MLTARRDAGAVLSTARCLPVFDTNGSSIERAEWIELIFRQRRFCRLILHWVVSKFGQLWNSGYFLLKLCPKLWPLKNFATVLWTSQMLSTSSDWLPSPVYHTEHLLLYVTRRAWSTHRVARVRLQQLRYIILKVRKFIKCSWHIIIVLSVIYKKISFIIVTIYVFSQNYSCTLNFLFAVSCNCDRKSDIVKCWKRSI